MFGNNKENGKEIIGVASNSTTIAKGTLLEGNIETTGVLRVEGKIIGNVKTKSKVSQGDTSLIDGNILSQNAEIAGEVKGKVEIAELLILKSTAVIHGDIITSKLVVEAGATFNGSCRMGATINEITIKENIESRQEQQPEDQLV